MLEDDFDGYATGPPPVPPWTEYYAGAPWQPIYTREEAAALGITISVDDETYFAGGKSVHFLDTTGSVGSHITRTFPPASQLVVEYYMRTHNGDYEGAFVTLMGDVGENWQVAFSSGVYGGTAGYIGVHGSPQGWIQPELLAYQLDTWYYVRRTLDLSTNTGSFYVEEVGNPSNNATHDIGANPNHPNTYVDRITVWSAWSQGADCHIDELKITSLKGATIGMGLIYDHFCPGIEARPGYHAVAGVALSPDESRLYAAHWQAGTIQSNDPIAVCSTADWADCLVLDVIYGGQCVGGVVTSNDGRYVYAPEYYGGLIWRYDTWNSNAKTSIDLGSWANKVWKTPNGERIIVNYNASSNVPSAHHRLALIDISDDNFSVIASFDAGRPLASTSAAFSNDGQHMYLAAGSSETTGPTLIDVDVVGTFEIERERPLVEAANQRWVLAGVARSGGTLFVGDKTGNKLHVVDEATFAKIDEVPLPDSPLN
ncbi:MAG: hypothetical protein HQ592_08890, partial [Planctomycetes bacterium]|nr:hypothetical protein [Planctomycetota bacterium]